MTPPKIDSVIVELRALYSETAIWWQNQNTGAAPLTRTALKELLDRWCKCYDLLIESEANINMSDYLDQAINNNTSLMPAAWYWVYYDDLRERLALELSSRTARESWAGDRKSFHSDFLGLMYKVEGKGAFAAQALDVNGVLASLEKIGPKNLVGEIDGYFHEVRNKLLEGWGSDSSKGWSCEKAALLMVLSCWRQDIRNEKATQSQIRLEPVSQGSIPIGAKASWVLFSLYKENIGDWDSVTVDIDLSDKNDAARDCFVLPGKSVSLSNWNSNHRTIGFPVCPKGEGSTKWPRILEFQVVVSLSGSKTIQHIPVSPSEFSIELKQQIRLPETDRSTVTLHSAFANLDQTQNVDDLLRYLESVCGCIITLDEGAIYWFNKYSETQPELSVQEKVFVALAKRTLEGGVDYMDISDMKTVLGTVDLQLALKINELEDTEKELLKLLNAEMPIEQRSQPELKAHSIETPELSPIPLSRLAQTYEASKSTQLEMSIVDKLVNKGWLKVEKGFLCGFSDDMRKDQISRMFRKDAC